MSIGFRDFLIRQSVVDDPSKRSNLNVATMKTGEEVLFLITVNLVRTKLRIGN